MGLGGWPMTTRFLQRAALLAVAVVATACAQRGPAPLYDWEKFPQQQYAVLKAGGLSPSEQALELEAHMTKAQSTGVAVPPGLRAHLGMLKLSLGDAEQARQLWMSEKQAFPESAPFMDRLLQRLDSPTKPGNPS